MILARVTVVGVQHPSPSFVRLTFAGPDLADFGCAGPFYDQRIKLLFPGPWGLPGLRPETWWQDHLALPEAERGTVRTYTVADAYGAGEERRLVVDVVLHPGEHGPGSAWAAGAAVGDELLAVVPRRDEVSGGIEFDPGAAEHVLLVGDETALPAVAQILRGLASLPQGPSTGHVFLEVPGPRDVVDLPAPPGFSLTWLTRNGSEVGDRLVETVVAHLGGTTGPVPEAAVDPEVWETPTYSSSGEQVAQTPEARARDYAWIAGEAGLVTRLRRHLVGELGMARSQVAFMGYWRVGVAMRA